MSRLLETADVGDVILKLLDGSRKENKQFDDLDTTGTTDIVFPVEAFDLALDLLGVPVDTTGGDPDGSMKNGGYCRDWLMDKRDHYDNEPHRFINMIRREVAQMEMDRDKRIENRVEEC